MINEELFIQIAKRIDEKTNSFYFKPLSKIESPFKDFSKSLKELVSIESPQKEDELNSTFVAQSYLESQIKYVETWLLLTKGKYSESWITLQNAASLLRLVKRFANYCVASLEARILSLEVLYPYYVFFSIDAIAETPKCSICGLRIDSKECLHQTGHLYNGQLAHRVIDKIIRIESIAYVQNPEDKKCVIQYENEGQQFELIRGVANMLIDEEMPLGSFFEAKQTGNEIKLLLDTGYLSKKQINLMNERALRVNNYV